MGAGLGEPPWQSQRVRRSGWALDSGGHPHGSCWTWSRDWPQTTCVGTTIGDDIVLWVWGPRLLRKPVGCGPVFGKAGVWMVSSPLQVQRHFQKQRWLQPPSVGGARCQGREVQAAPGPASAFSSSAPPTGGSRAALTPARVPLAPPEREAEAAQVLPWTPHPGASSRPTPSTCFPNRTSPLPVMGLFVFSSVQWLSRVRLFATPWTAARQASLSITNSRSSPKLMLTESVMPSNHLILCRPLLLPPSIFPSIRVFSSESALRIFLSWGFFFFPLYTLIFDDLEYSDIIVFQASSF